MWYADSPYSNWCVCACICWLGCCSCVLVFGSLQVLHVVMNHLDKTQWWSGNQENLFKNIKCWLWNLFLYNIERHTSLWNNRSLCWWNYHILILLLAYTVQYINFLTPDYIMTIKFSILFNHTSCSHCAGFYTRPLLVLLHYNNHVR